MFELFGLLGLGKVVLVVVHLGLELMIEHASLPSLFSVCCSLGCLVAPAITVDDLVWVGESCDKVGGGLTFGSIVTEVVEVLSCLGSRTVVDAATFVDDGDTVEEIVDAFRDLVEGCDCRALGEVCEDAKGTSIV